MNAQDLCPSEEVYMVMNFLSSKYTAVKFIAYKSGWSFILY